MGRPKKSQEQVATGEPPKVETTPEINKDEYNVEITRDYYGNIDPFYLSKKDPNYQYRFLRDDHKNITLKTTTLLFQKGGWQICPKEHLLKIGVKERELSPDGFLRRGDNILAFIPKQYHQEKVKFQQEKSAEVTKGIERMLKKGDPSAGKGIHDTMKGIQTKKDLGM